MNKALRSKLKFLAENKLLQSMPEIGQAYKKTLKRVLRMQDIYIERLKREYPL